MGLTHKTDTIRLINFPVRSDSRGSLSFAQTGDALPFEAKRIFFIYDVAEGAQRGGHAHCQSQMVLIAACGSMRVTAFDGKCETVYELASPSIGLYVPTGIWTILEDFAPGTVCVVVSDTHYNPDEYLHSRSEFEEWLQQNSRHK